MFFFKKIILLVVMSLCLNAELIFSTNYNNLIEYITNGFVDMEYTIPSDTITPNLNIIENQNSYKYYFELAGFDKKDISVKLKNNVLFVETTKRFKNIKKYRGIKIEEISSSFFKRKVKLEKDINLKNIIVNYNNGILEVIIKKDFSKNSNKIQTLKIN